MRRAILFLTFLILFSALGHAQIRSECPDQSKACTPLWWDSNTEPDVDRYFVYRSDTSCQDPSPEPSTCPSFVKISPAISQGPSLTTPRFIDENVEFGKAYTYTATAVNSSDLESAFSSQLGVQWANPNRPSPPGGFRGVEQGANLRLDWDDNPVAENVNLYNVHKSSSEDEWGQVIAMVTISEYRDMNPGRIGPKFLWVTAVNDQGSESIPSGPVIYRGK